MFKFGLLIATGAILSGCVTLGDTSITRLDKTSYFGKSTIRYATQDGLFKTEVVGAPFELISAQDIADKLHMPGGFTPAQFKTDVPVDRKMNSHRTVIAFNTSDHVRGQTLCAKPSETQSTLGQNPLKAQIALCVGDEVFAEGQIVAKNVTGFEDPAFEKAINSLLLAVLKQRDETMRDKDKPEFVPPG